MLGATLGAREYLDRVCREIQRLDVGQIEAFSQVVYLTPDEMAGMAGVIRALLAQYRHREVRPAARPPEAAPVAVVARLFPLLELGGAPRPGSPR